VFGVLLRGGQAHLAKLRKENRGAYVNIERRIEEIAAHLRDYPPTLGLHGQALFALGYYHQRAHNRAAAQEKRAQKENAGVDSDA
jgi:CRISPR-associated protein Csd1